MGLERTASSFSGRRGKPGKMGRVGCRCCRFPAAARPSDRTFCVRQTVARVTARIGDVISEHTESVRAASRRDLCGPGRRNADRRIDSGVTRLQDSQTRAGLAFPHYFQLLQTAEERQAAPLRFRAGVGETHVGKALEEREDRYLRLEPRQRRADAKMQPAAEGDMRRLLAGDVEAMRLMK